MKNIYLSLLSATVIGSGLFAALPTFAGEKKSKSEKPAKKKSAFFPFRGKIKSVDAEKSVLTLPGAKGKPDRVFTLVKEAKLTLDGERQSSAISRRACMSEVEPNAFPKPRWKRTR